MSAALGSPAPAPAYVPLRIVSQAEYARQRGCSAPYVSKLIKQGRIAPPALRPDGKIDLDQLGDSVPPPAPQLAIQTPDAAAPGNDAAPTAYTDARTRREQANAEIAELDLAERQGRLIDRRAAENEFEGLAQRLRDALLLVPAAVAEECAGQSAGAIEATVLAAIERALEDARTEEPADAV